MNSALAIIKPATPIAIQNAFFKRLDTFLGVNAFF